MARLDPTGVSRILSYIKTWVTTALGGKANSSHNHTKSQITDFPTIPSKTSQLTNDSGFLTSHQSLSNYLNKSTEQTTTASKIAKGNDVGWYADSTDGTLRIRLIIGGGGENRGIWDDKLQKWIVYANNTSCYLNGNAATATSAGYVQGNNNSANAANALLRSGGGRTDSSPEGDTWIFLDSIGGSDTPWGFKHNQAANTIGFYARGTETSSINLSNGYFSGSCNYANSSGNADTLDGYHHDSFPKTYSALFTVNGLGTPGWSTIGMGTGGSCIQVKTTDNTYPSICFHRSGYSHCVLAEYSGQLGTMHEGDGTFNHLITSANIGSQSVNYANSAGSVAWGNVSGRPTALSQFTNDSEFWSPGGGKWNPNANISLPASGNGQEWSFDMHRNGKTGCYWHVWEDSLGTLLKVNADDGAVSVPRNIFYLGSYKVYVG